MQLVNAHSPPNWNVTDLPLVINKTSTRLDTEDLTLWREAGLMISEQAQIMPSNTTASGYFREGAAVAREEVICNTLVWLMAKLANFMATDDEISDKVGTPRSGISQRTLFDQWFSLRKQFQLWHKRLPITFTPSGRVASSHRSAQISNDGNDSMFTEIWYLIPMCASTMQAYHMSQILLFMNRPYESGVARDTVVARMNYYQSVQAICQSHSREIVGISLARADKAVRIHSVEPLFTAGQCLSDERERRVILRLLQDIESDIGWATDYRVRRLVKEWQREELEGAVLCHMVTSFGRLPCWCTQCMPSVNAHAAPKQASQNYYFRAHNDRYLPPQVPVEMRL